MIKIVKIIFKTQAMVKFFDGLPVSSFLSILAIIFMVVANVLYRFKNRNNIASLSYVVLILKIAASVAMSLLLSPLKSLPIGNVILAVLFSLIAISVSLITLIPTESKNYFKLSVAFYITVFMFNFSILIG